MIYVTGDTHADLDRIKKSAAKQLRRNDTLIICGDFGFVWDGSAEEQKVLAWLGKRKFDILFVEGTHDNLDLLAQYPVVQYKGGYVRQISERLYHMMRGEIYTIEEKKVFAFGGGESTDIDARVPGETWWQSELPSADELENARKHLAAAGNQLDYVITHEACPSVFSFLNMDENRTNPMAVLFDWIFNNVKFTSWYFGASHMDKQVSPSLRAVYQDVVPAKGHTD